ncbi:tetratricopeptide repeat protein [Streptomyces avicenniae]|uniref:tetratricopeptide repeat protein n=1 Tax=Streptomyces avicenniae TaxID=500153 RepID=UPI00167EB04D|nr:tetratricopeptide repeat protein [Streptomyces avicenniae]
MEGLIAVDGRGRMVPGDRVALARHVARLLDGSPSARDLRQAGVGALVLGEFERAAELLRRALELADAREVVAAHVNLGDLHRYQGDTDTAEPHYQEALRLAHAGQPGLVHFCLQHLGKQRTDQGRTPEAVAFLREALRLRRALGDPALVAATEDALRLAEARRVRRPGA